MSEFLTDHQNGLLLTVLILSILGVLLSAYLFYRYMHLKQEMSTLFAGKGAVDLESTILRNNEELAKMDTDIEELYKISNKVHALSQRSLHRSALKRYNPFGDMGGNQSFSLALLDGHYDGVVISSLHTREGGTRLYIKEVATGGTHNADFTDEERSVITQARDNKTSTT